jgi:DNA repair protein RecO (recombination protein O)
VAIVEDEALVLRSIRHGETSRIATLLTRRHGKVHVIAKGARDLKSRFGSALEPLTLVHAVFYLKKHRSLQFLSAACAERAFGRVLASPRAYHIASAGLEFVDRVITDEDPVPEVFTALLRFLDGCERRPDHPRAELRLRAFQLHTVSLLGYAPQLDRCAACGRAADPPAGFGVSEGGVLCRDCAVATRPLALSPAALGLLREVVAGAQPASAAGEGRIAERPTPGRPASADREVIAAVEAFLQYHVTGYRGLRALRSLETWLDFAGGSRPAPPPQQGR